MIRKIYFTIVSLIISAVSFAQTADSTNQFTDSTTILYVIVGLVLLISILVLLVAIYTLSVVRTILARDKIKDAGIAGEVEEEEKESFWDRISRTLTNAKPVEEEEEILLDHDYDGIKELDNHLPPWWKGLFYLTIIWAMGYLVVYHVFNWLPLSGEEYQQQVKKAEAALEERKANAPQEAIDENNVSIATDESALQNGETTFKRQCAVCHRQDGGGNVGPNLTDDYWIHGGNIRDIFHTIKYGVPEKGMISWQSQLNPTEMRNVASYIKTKLVGSNPPNPKASQGELYTPEENTDESGAQDSTKVEKSDAATGNS